MAETVVVSRQVGERMRTDARLPPEIVPTRETAGPQPRSILLTGGTGFLGRYLLRELLASSDRQLFCLVRAADDESARIRLLSALNAGGARLGELPPRVRVIPGDATVPRLGLGEADYERLAGEIGDIYHCAAEVNWARGYRQLHRTNVLPVQELIRLACRGPLKRIYFVSTIGVCFASGGPARVDEDTDMMPYVEQMPLGYAQSKCVAETLLRQAAARGVPVSVVRPGLISGDTTSGISNDSDILCALLERCVATGSAFDIDWLMDCVPVDFVARVLRRLGETRRPDWEVLHLVHDQGRHWREVLLWMNLYGYPIRLEPEEAWVAANFDRGGRRDRLFGYRRFFRGAPGSPAKSAPYRSYLAAAQERVDAKRTGRLLEELDLRVPHLDSALLHNYFTHYASTGVLPRIGRAVVPVPAAERHRELAEDLLRAHFAAAGTELVNVVERPFRSSNSILNEISSIRLGSRVGMHCYEAVVRDAGCGGTRRVPVLLKSKAADSLIEELMTEVAGLYDDALGRQCERFKALLGFSRCHERELSLYELDDARLRRHTPACYGTSRDPDNGVWSLALELLPDAERLDAEMACGGWSDRHVATAIAGLAEIHAIGYRRECEIGGLPWLAPEMTTDRMQDMAPFWLRLAECSERAFSAWAGYALLPLQRRLIDTLSQWWPAVLDMPRTLIHNDFNPRNLVLRQLHGREALCAFDWELATVGLPQRDLAELLCFVLQENVPAARVDHYVECHRLALARAAGVKIDDVAWREGFRLSLQHLIVDRLPMYAVIHRFKPQAYLPRVVRSWPRLYGIACQLAEERRSHWPRRVGEVQGSFGA